MAEIKPGDRVRVAGDDEILEVIAMNGDLSAVSSVPKDPEHRPVVLLTAKLELVEIAHYAPPGVPMVAMTPVRIEALRRASSRAEDHLLKTRANWTPGVAEAEADANALASMLAEVPA